MAKIDKNASNTKEFNENSLNGAKVSSNAPASLIEQIKAFLTENYEFQRVGKHIEFRKKGSDSFEVLDKNHKNDLFFELQAQGIKATKTDLTTLLESSFVPKKETPAPPESSPKKGKENDLPTFFFVQVKQGNVNLGISQNHLINFLRENGFCYLELGESRELVQIIDQIVFPTKLYKIKRCVTDFLALQTTYQSTITVEEEDEHGEVVKRTRSITFKKEQLIEKFMIGSSAYVGSDKLDFLESLKNLDYLKDTRDKAFLLYQNGYVEVGKEGYKLFPYSTLKTLKKYVRHDQILQRDFTPVELPQTYEHIFNDPSQAPTESKYNILDFVNRLCGKSTFENNEFAKRFEAFQTHMGYLAHDFFEYKRKIVIFTDRNLTNIENPEGRTGKGIVGQFVMNIRNSVKIEGKSFKIENKHRWEKATHTTQYIHLDDIAKNIDFETFFNDVDSINVDKKGIESFSREIKLGISSNYLPKGTGDSFRDRWAIFDVIRFFEGDKENGEKSRNPLSFYGEYFFAKKWTPESWQIFDNFMAQCLQAFFQNNCQIIAVQSPEMRLVNFMRQTNPEFVKFVLPTENSFYTLKDRYGVETKGIETNHQYVRKDIFAQFKEAFPDHDKIKQRTFTTWFKQLATYQNWLFLDDSDERNKSSNGNDFYMFVMQ